MLVFEFRVTITGLAVDPLDQPLNVYPEFGVAVILTWVPELKLPKDGATLPPSPAVAVRIYFGVILLGVVAGSCEFSLAQVNRSKKERYRKNLFIDIIV
tara:strand:+ start:55 stop:351 length:297 start_codon:yes stop_codon:yes gene_type:complete